MSVENSALENEQYRDQLAADIAVNEFGTEAEITYLAQGIDSIVFLVEHGQTRKKAILKVYHYDPQYADEWGVHTIDQYAEWTNQLAAEFKFFDALEIEDETWKAEFTVLPINTVGEKDRVAYSTSDFMPGEDLYDRTIATFGEKLNLKFQTTDGDQAELSEAEFKAIRKHLGMDVFTKSIRTRLDDVEDAIEEALGVTNVSLETGNIRLVLDRTNKKLHFVITDIGGNIRRIRPKIEDAIRDRIGAMT